MKIARYIGDLLYDYECVVVPGLGGFLASETSATINSVTHHFKPPFKKVFFNAQLRANDGLLVNYVAKEQGLTYKDAKSQVDQFVFLCHDALKNGKRINFHRIGTIFYNEKEQVVFEQDTSINYDAEAFGLIGFISPAVRRVTQEDRLKEKLGVKNSSDRQEHQLEKKPVDRKPEKLKSPVMNEIHKGPRPMKAEVHHSPFKTQLTFLSIILLAILIGIGMMHKETVKVYYNKYASAIPLFYRSPNSYLIDNIAKTHLVRFSNSKTGILLAQWIDDITKKKSSAPANANTDETNTKNENVAPPVADNNLTNKSNQERKVPDNSEQDTVIQEKVGTVQQASLLGTILDEGKSEETVSEEKPVEEVVPAASKPAATVNEPALSGENIYIIAGSFKRVSNARRLVRILLKKGYQAQIADTNSYGMYRVAYGRFSDIAEAKKQLVSIRNQENNSAWMMKK